MERSHDYSTRTYRSLLCILLPPCKVTQSYWQSPLYQPLNTVSLPKQYALPNRCTRHPWYVLNLSLLQNRWIALVEKSPEAAEIILQSTSNLPATSGSVHPPKVPDSPALLEENDGMTLTDLQFSVMRQGTAAHELRNCVNGF